MVWNMAQTSQLDWLNEGLRALAQVNADGLTIDFMTARLGVTKGSFYHHFGSYPRFVEALLAHFEDIGTSQIITITAAAGEPLAKLKALIDISTDYAAQTEVAIRAWALHDKTVQAVQERIDQRRVDYVCQLLGELGFTESKAQILAQVLYTLLIGGYHLQPPLGEQRLSQLFQDVLAHYGLKGERE
jgi:AcrR family transcriptional regulator